jgi:hypothetical protein
VLTLPLNAPIALVPGLSLAQKYASSLREYPHLPDPVALVTEMNRLCREGGLPVSVDDKGPWIRFYTQRGCLAVRPTTRGDAYSIEFLNPMTLHNHGRLARSVLRLSGPGLVYFGQLREVPAGYQAPDQQIRAAWRQAQTRQEAAQPPRSARLDALCDALELVIEGGRQIEAARDPADRILSYYEVQSTSQARRSAAGIYDFLLSRPASVQPGAMVELRDQPDLRGRVRTVDGERLTVGFDTSIDRRRIPEQGDLVLSRSDVIQRVQGDAVARLRDGSTRNPRLASVLVDAAFAGYHEEAIEPDEPLDENQEVAFRRALAVPDLLCVVGPPGTGKTRTIVEIARAAAARGERVLIASQTNTAVDNVIERMPDSITTIRVGNEERMSGAARRRTLAEVAGELQRRISERTEATARRLEPWLGAAQVPLGWLDRLDQSLASMNVAASQRDAALAEKLATAEAVVERDGDRMRARLSTLRTAVKAVESTTNEADRWATKLQRAEERATGLFGVWYGGAARRHRRRLEDARPRAAAAITLEQDARRAYEVERAELESLVTRDPAVGDAARRADAAAEEATRKERQAQQAAVRLLRLMAGVEPVQSPGSDLAAFAEQCRALAPILRERAELLAEWRTRLQQPSEQLHAELIRYADVIGSTCIGVGVQRNGLSDVDFDLAVIDEAGQIPMPSTLVPMARARRVVLVGDHRQLPPFVDDDVRQWLSRQDLAGMDEVLVRDLLTHSAFERLLRGTPAANQVMLNLQRRMPRVLADFVSDQFYGGRLKTVERNRPPSPLFRSPLAVVDTSALTAAERSERSRARTETWQVTGRDNRAEAALVVNLVQWYAGRGDDWAVIAPYRAQVQLIDIRVRELVGDKAASDRIGTVDTFQGQEKDVVIFSFTRSNRGGSVGFLGELRRLNVAMTRARNQLVLVGDRSTLAHARDSAFRDLAAKLFAYADRHGDVVPADELHRRLAGAHTPFPDDYRGMGS